MKNIRLMLGVVVAGGVLVSANVFAKESANTNPYKKVLRNVPVLELPAQAAKIIKQAKEADRESVTIEVIAAISETKPAAIPAVVGTIARTTPAQAAIAAAAATQYQPELALTVVKSAVTIAPKMASTIVLETCRRAPRQFQGIAITAAEAAPSASLEILAAVSSAIPAIKPAIEQAVTASKTPQPVVEAIVTAVPKIVGPTLILTPEPKYQLVSVSPLADASSAKALSAGSSPTLSAASGPIVGLPFQRLPPYVPGEITPNNTYQVPEGGRNYAAP